ncbi:hypothetical protein CC1G_08231 [Coprinopsis cinerea okayama7|uniref:Uncharacterized protein n=1 Tax=Coprinopsis cinerea (strain Okayama-7 / 130 / ATCC MYA-4618 / FGSC 9003) TaxID=240176 RepID=A8P7I0_COPC7|nr:hypothetical protein CC1G_08231 [Coprinopsis cinerea okayama7\|eukprot:XP_001839364.2 hypothetical protein CC1G_08231 [Coprinopsis cinerea okayama7\
MSSKAGSMSEDLKLFELGLPDQTIALAISFGSLSTSESERVLAYKEECKAQIIALAQSVILLDAATYDEYRKIQRRMQVCDALLSDIRSLPSDILDEILTHFLWTPPVEPWSGTFQTRQHKDEGVIQAHRRDIFRQVCRPWDVAALSNLEHWLPMKIEWCSDKLRRQAVDAPSAGGSSRLRGGQRRFPFFDRRLESAYLSKLDLFDALAYPWSLLLHVMCFSINDDGRREASADEENRVWEINQPYLTHLVIYSSSRFDIPTNPRWPSLKTFKLILPMFEYMQTLQFGWHGAIQSFNMATLDSFRHLNHLTLDGDIQTGRFATEIVPFLEAAPQLTELFLRLLCQDNDEVVRSLV